eukprot:Nitzschia sp. Nitz4//scaffold19_size178191//104730//105310//NITZ4_001985-RA/size178191-augustus-gene-0.109-mRNA-1//-1//CDS//3329540705//5280//frame0
MQEAHKQLLGLDKKDRNRAIFLYDGPCGVCKFLAGFVLERDVTDHFRLVPIQTKLGQELCRAYDRPADVSTAVLMDEQGSHTHSTAVLRLFLYMGSGYPILGWIALYMVPRVVRDFAYTAFARHRGAIWKLVKYVTGMGDTSMAPYRDRVLGLEEPIDPSWSF